MRKTSVLFSLAALFACMAVSAQCKFCYSYEDFVDNKWEPLDTVFTIQHSKSHQLWWGGNDFSLKTGNASLDKKLKKQAFIIMQADTMYVNCRNLRYENTRFNNGFTKAMRIGNRSVLFVNKIIGKEARDREATTAFMFGAIGSAITLGDHYKQQVCYVISASADEKGHIHIRLINDGLMDQMIEGRDDLHIEYYSEQDDDKRILASHIIPILEKAGLFKYKTLNEGMSK